MTNVRPRLFRNLILLTVLSVILFFLSSQLLHRGDYGSSGKSIANPASKFHTIAFSPKNFKDGNDRPLSANQNWLNYLSNSVQNVHNKLFKPYIEGFRQWALNNQRELIRQEMIGYEYQNPNTKLDDLVIEKGGQPIRSAVFTTWRSGSTFLGEALNAHPASFYHYEPLLPFEIIQVRNGSEAKEAVRMMTELMSCGYNNMDNFTRYGQTNHWLYNHNTRLWKYCDKNHKVCWSTDFLSKMCKMFPFQVVKTVRLRLKLAEKFLAENEWKTRIILVIRDPRATMQSRGHRLWCPGNPDCDNPANLCQDMVEDYDAAKKFRALYPSKFMALRHEDISLNPTKAMRKIFKFYHLNYHERVQTFIETHTKKNNGGVSSTFRDSKKVPFHWKEDYAGNFSAIESIEKKCQLAMSLWGYYPVKSAEKMKETVTLGDAPWPEMSI